MCGTDVISIYIFIQFMENIPISLDESAIIDGASYWTIYWKIMLPLLKPAIVTSCILKGVGVYNEYYMANLYLMDKVTYNRDITLYICWPDGKSVQSDLCRCYHFPASGIDRIYPLSETDLQWNCCWCSKRLKRERGNGYE